VRRCISIAQQIDRQKIIASVAATWPDPSAPLIYFSTSNVVWPMILTAKLIINEAVPIELVNESRLILNLVS
jgi:hypothetical protein